MNSRIYLQPDAVPEPAAIRTANRLFRHFGKEVTFLQQPTDGTLFPDITMNRLRWALVNVGDEDEKVMFAESLQKASNLVIDFADFTGDEAAAAEKFQTLFEASDEVANLVLIKKKSEELLELAKTDQSKAKRK